MKTTTKTFLARKKVVEMTSEEVDWELVINVGCETDSRGTFLAKPAFCPSPKFLPSFPNDSRCGTASDYLHVLKVVKTLRYEGAECYVWQVST